MAVCPNCGAENPSKSKWCGKCGNTLPDMSKWSLCRILSGVYLFLCFLTFARNFGYIVYLYSGDSHWLSFLDEFSAPRLIIASVWFVLLLIAKPPLKKHYKVLGILFILLGSGISLWHIGMKSWRYSALAFELPLLMLAIVCGILALGFVQKERKEP